MLEFVFGQKYINQINSLSEENILLRKKVEELENTLIQKSEECEQQKKFFLYLKDGTENLQSNLALRLSGHDDVSGVINQTFQSLDEKLTNIVFSMVRVSESNRVLDNSIETLKQRSSEQVNLIKYISNANRDFTDQTETITLLGKKLEEMAETSSVVSDEGSRMLRENLRIFKSLGQQIDDNSRFMNELSESIDSVGELTALIIDIAERLNLLSINASIESARSGEAGKGFAVVAQYMKVLSDDTAKSVNEVTAIMNTLANRSRQMEEAWGKILDSVNTGNELFESGISKFDWIYESIRELKDTTGTISLALESQLAAISQIASSTDGLQESGEEVLQLNGYVSDSAVNLESIVQAVVDDVSSFKLGLHHRALSSLEGVIEHLPQSANWEDIQQKLKTFLVKASSFELLYAMDNGGIQQTDNIANPAFQDIISKAGKGENRSSKAYFKEVLESGRPFVSNIYLSSATGNLCITVSTALLSDDGLIFGVLAGDVNLHNGII